MRILQVSECEKIGGASLASLRLYNELKKRNIKSTLLVGRKSSDNHEIIAAKTFFGKFIARLKPHLYIWYSRRKFDSDQLTALSKASSNIFKEYSTCFDYDVMHLHWVNNGFVKLNDLLTINKPMIWTLHDTWLFTGGCHSPHDCKQFLTDCSCCPKSGSKKGTLNLYRQFLEKKEVLNSLTRKITITVPSNWMLENAKKSELLKEFDIIKIPNIINTDIFNVFNKHQIKRKLNLDINIKYFIFGASNPLGDKNKGFEYLRLILEDPKYDQYKLIIFGRVPFDTSADKLYSKIVFCGEIDSDEKLAEFYNAAEALLMPSLHESFGQVAAEAMACGLPVLCFDTTGLKDIVEHKKTGYLAKLGDIDDYKNGLDWIIAHWEEETMGSACRNKILSEFSPDVICQKYTALYAGKTNYAESK